MAYKLNEEWFETNTEGVITLPQLGLKFNLSIKSDRKRLSKNKAALETLYKYKSPFVVCDKKGCKAHKECTKKKKVNGIKEASSKEEGQVSTTTSEEK
tara:strand:- start:16594 stop:16887 length:294 start_codon:yes stop_codon:yes gene_type:complete